MDQIRQDRRCYDHTHYVCCGEFAPNKINGEPAKYGQATCKPKCSVKQLPIKR